MDWPRSACKQASTLSSCTVRQDIFGAVFASGGNRRGDEYGGSLSNRLRFIERVLDASTLPSASEGWVYGFHRNPYNDHVDATK